MGRRRVAGGRNPTQKEPEKKSKPPGCMHLGDVRSRVMGGAAVWPPLSPVRGRHGVRASSCGSALGRGRAESGPGSHLRCNDTRGERGVTCRPSAASPGSSGAPSFGVQAEPALQGKRSYPCPAKALGTKLPWRQRDTTKPFQLTERCCPQRGGPARCQRAVRAGLRRAPFPTLGRRARPSATGPVGGAKSQASQTPCKPM